MDLFTENSVRKLTERVTELEERVRQLELDKQRLTHPIPWVSTAICQKCGGSHIRSVIVCGAMPQCPECKSTQSSWEGKSGTVTQYRPICS